MLQNVRSLKCQHCREQNSQVGWGRLVVLPSKNGAIILRKYHCEKEHIVLFCVGGLYNRSRKCHLYTVCINSDLEIPTIQQLNIGTTILEHLHSSSSQSSKCKVSKHRLGLLVQQPNFCSWGPQLDSNNTRDYEGICKLLRMRAMLKDG